MLRDTNAPAQAFIALASVLTEVFSVDKGAKSTESRFIFEGFQQVWFFLDVAGR